MAGRTRSGWSRENQLELYHSQPSLRNYKTNSEDSLGVPASRTKSLPVSTVAKPLKYLTSGAFPITRATVNWKRLPASILELVLHWLKNSHLGHGSSSCTTCYMRDLSSVQSTCRAWYPYAQRLLYSDIQLVGQDDDCMLRRWRLSKGARLTRLRSTLRSKKLLAALVKTIHVPDPHIPLYSLEGDSNPEYDAYLCILASVVMECPNLEALTGFYPFYNHTFDRLTHALSTRARLKQHIWVIAENDDVNARSLTQLPPGILDHEQVYQFLHYHDRWANLETLMLCSPGSLGVIEHHLLIDVLHSLPCLAHLCISSFDIDDFYDATLQALPVLKSLRLEECSGVTEAGLTRWAASPRAFTLQRLSLVHQGIDNLLTLSKILASLEHLIKLTIVQKEEMPSLTLHDQNIIVQPVLASKSLRFLHWDIDGHHGGHDKSNWSTGHDSPYIHSLLMANEHLALSIQHRGFPALEKLRVPHDTLPYGILQSVCLPISDPCIQEMKDLDAMDDFHKNPYSNSLRVARLRAQRIAWKTEQQNQLMFTARTSSDGISESVKRRSQIKTLPYRNSLSASFETRTSSASQESSFVTAGTTLTTSNDNIPDPGCFGETRDAFLEASLQSHYFSQDPNIHDLALSNTQESTPATNDGRNIQAAEFLSHLPQTDLPLTPPPRSELRPRQARPTEQHTPSARQVQQPAGLTISQSFKRPQLHLEPDIPGRNANGGLIGWAELLGVREKGEAAISLSNPTLEQSVTKSSKNTDWDSESETEQDTAMNGELCDGSWNRHTHAKASIGSDDTSLLKRILTSKSQSSAKVRAKGDGRAREKTSSSKLSPASSVDRHDSRNLIWRHVPRPRGEKGGAVDVDQFF